MAGVIPAPAVGGGATLDASIIALGVSVATLTAQVQALTAQIAALPTLAQFQALLAQHNVAAIAGIAAAIVHNITAARTQCT
jgi:hypothetical protein